MIDPTNEEAVKAEMRLYAIEVFVSNLFAVSCLASSQSPLSLAEKIREQMLEGARKRTFPGFDAAISDLLSAELEAAVNRLATMGSDQIRHVQKNRGTSR